MPVCTEVFVLCDSGADCAREEEGPTQISVFVPVDIPVPAFPGVLAIRLRDWAFETQADGPGLVELAAQPDFDLSQILTKVLCPSCLAAGKVFTGALAWIQVKGDDVDESDPDVRRLTVEMTGTQVKALRAAKRAWVYQDELRVESEEGEMLIFHGPAGPKGIHGPE